MLRPCTVTGSFVCEHGKPVQGLVRFMPYALWIYEENTRWATLAPELVLGPDGAFVAELTATDSGSYPWTYHAYTPAGVFEFMVPWRETGYTLRELIHEHRAGARTEDR